MRLENKVAIVTGSGLGIGRAIAILFAKEGAKVVVASRSAGNGEKTVEIIRDNGGTAEFVRTNVAVAADVEHAARFTYDRFGGIDILVNNAGVYCEEAPIEEASEADWDQVFAVNVKGQFLAAKYVVPYMKKAGKGTIVNLGSRAAYEGGPFIEAYASSKGAVISLTRILARELGPMIRVNCVNPTVTNTRMADKLPEEVKTHLTNTLPLRRFASPDDVAQAVLFLASDESAMITGADINIDGGSAIS